MLNWHFTKKLPKGYLIIYHHGHLFSLANFFETPCYIDKIHDNYFYARVNKKDFPVLLENYTEKVYESAIIWASNNIEDCDSVSTIVSSLIDYVLSFYDKDIDWPDGEIIEATTDIF